MEDFGIQPHTGQSRPTAVTTAELPPAQLEAWIPGAHRRVRAHLRRLGVPPAGPPFAHLPLVEPPHPWACTVEAGYPTAHPVPGNGSVRASSMPHGPIAVTVHAGDPRDFRAAYRNITSWLHQVGGRPRGSCWLIYLIGPDDHPDPARWRTQLIVPYRRRPAPSLANRRTPL